MDKRILIIDNEPGIGEFISGDFQKNHFLADLAADINDAVSKMRVMKYDLVLLEPMLPAHNGFELCRIIKTHHEFSNTPLIILTAKSEEVDKVLGLELGADDYVTKPFSSRELLARIKAVLRRYSANAENGSEEEWMKAGPLLINFEKFKVTRAGLPLEISAKEFKLLIYLAQRPGKILNRDLLLEAVWGREAYIEPRTVDVHIRRLREKIEEDPSAPQFIRTKRGSGYYFHEGG